MGASFKFQWNRPANFLPPGFRSSGRQLRNLCPSRLSRAPSAGSKALAEFLAYSMLAANYHFKQPVCTSLTICRPKITPLNDCPSFLMAWCRQASSLIGRDLVGRLCNTHVHPKLKDRGQIGDQFEACSLADVPQRRKRCHLETNQILQNGAHFCCYNVISSGGNAFAIGGR
jgi:hypothetical protein